MTKSDVDIRKYVAKVVPKTTPPIVSPPKQVTKQYQQQPVKPIAAPVATPFVTLNPIWQPANPFVKPTLPAPPPPVKGQAKPVVTTNPLTPHWAAPNPFETHNPLWKPATPFEPNRRNPLSPDWMLPTPVPPRKEMAKQTTKQNDPHDVFAMTNRANTRRAWEEKTAAENYFNSLPPLIKGATKDTGNWQGYGLSEYDNSGGYSGGGYSGDGYSGGGYSGYASWINNLTSWNIG